MESSKTLRRKLNPDLKEWFDSRCVQPPSPAFATKLWSKMLLEGGFQCVGITEIGSDNHGKMVELFQETIGRAEGEPWCLALIQSLVAYVESFGIESKLFPTEHCLTAWTNSQCPHPIEPMPGDIVVWRHGDTTKGHVGLVVKAEKSNLYTIEGNTGPATGEIEREGDGVYEKVRPRGGLGSLRELGFLRPFPNL